MAKKATVKIRGVGEAKENLLKLVSNAIKDQTILKEVGSLAVQQIKSSTRARLEEYKQPELTPSTVDRRKSLIESGNAFDSKIVSPRRSNLSMSGQLLSSLTYRINQTLGEVTLFLTPLRRAYKGRQGQNLENIKDNNQVNADLESQGRRFLFISARVENRLQAKIVEKLRKAIQIYNKIKRKLS